MRSLALIGVFMACQASTAFAQASTNEIADLKKRVAELEKQVQDLTKILEPIKAHQDAEARQKSFRIKFEVKMAEDRAKYSQEQLREAEKLYQIANQDWGSNEAMENLKTMIKKYPDINRTGCAILYVAQQSSGPDRDLYLNQCIEKHNGCFYGDGVQVGAYARLLLALDHKDHGEPQKAEALFKELKEKFPDAIDHSGKLLSDAIPKDDK